MALSSDGNTALLYGAGDGAAWIFTRSGSTWGQDGPKLIGAGAVTGGGFGGSAALAADGRTAVIGVPGQSGFVGGAFVFVRSASGWTQQGAMLRADCTASCGGPSGTGEAGAGSFGSSVAVSSDGSTALIGAEDNGGNPDMIGPGGAWVFARTGTSWSQQGPPLIGTGAIGTAGQGDAVALSADGNTALVGGLADDNGVGAAWVFTRAGASWTQQTKLAGGGASGAEYQLSGVALAGDGNTALLGSPTDRTSATGAALVFIRAGSAWSEQTPELVGTGAVGTSEQGSSVALSSDGGTALVGGPADNGNLGAAWPFTVGPQVTVVIAGTGAGTVSGSGISCPGTCSVTLPASSQVTLTATPLTGSSFAGWSGGPCTDHQTVCSFAVTATTQLTATFMALPKCSLKVSTNRVLFTKERRRTAARVRALPVIADCDQSAQVTLTGALLDVTRHHHTKRTRHFKLGGLHRAVKANTSTKLAIKLPRKATRDLATGAAESVSLKLLVTAATGTTQASAAIRRLKGVRAPKPRTG